MAKNFFIILPKMDDDDTAVADEIDEIIETMTDEAATFPDPNPKLPEFQTANDAYRASIPTKRNWSIALQEVMEGKKAIVVEMARLQSLYVLAVAKGDRAIAKKSGFRLSSDERIKKVQTKPLVKAHAPGAEPGTLKLSLAGDAGSQHYQAVQEQADGKFLIFDSFSNIRGALIRNLPSGDVEIQIRGKRGNTYGPLSDKITVRVF